MAFASTVVWEVQTGGSDSNGGGFDPVSGTPGTDYSQQTSPQVTYTDLVIDGTTNTKCTSAVTPFTSAHVGNIINITGGTGFTVQRVQVMSVTAGAATCDKSLGTLGSTGGTGNLGGCLLTLGAVAALVVAGNDVWIKAGTYTVTATVPISVAGTLGNPIQWRGYETARGDATGTRPLLTSATNSVALITISAAHNAFRNIKFSHTAGTRGYGFRAPSGQMHFHVLDCEFDGCLSAVKADNAGAEYPMFGLISDCYIHDCTGYGLRVANAIVSRCTVKSNAGGGIFVGNFNNAVTNIDDCIIYSNTGDGANLGTAATASCMVNIRNNVIASNTGDGVDDSGGTGINNGVVENNIIFDNGGYGLNLSGNSGRALVFRKNAYKDNVSGAITATCPAGEGDITLTADPFTNEAGGDYSLNNTSGGGAAVRALAYPSSFPGGLTAHYDDIGAAQHADPVGGSGGGLKLAGRGGLAG